MDIVRNTSLKEDIPNSSPTPHTSFLLPHPILLKQVYKCNLSILSSRQHYHQGKRVLSKKCIPIKGLAAKCGTVVPGGDTPCKVSKITQGLLECWNTAKVSKPCKQILQTSAVKPPRCTQGSKEIFKSYTKWK